MADFKKMFTEEEVNEIAKTIKPGEMISFEGYENSPSSIFIGSSSVEGDTALYIVSAYSLETGTEVIGFYGGNLLVGSFNGTFDIINGKPVPRIADREYNFTNTRGIYSGNIIQGGRTIGTYRLIANVIPNETTCTITLTTAPSGTMTLEGNPPNFTGVLIDPTSGEQALISCADETLHFSGTSTGTFKGGVTLYE